MSKLMRKLALSLSILFAVGLLAGEADAQKKGRQAKSKQAKKAYKIKDGRQARGPVLRNYKAKGRSTNVRVTSFGRSKSGKSLQVLVETKGSGTVRALNVRDSNGVAYETGTQAVSQKKATTKANQKLRRQNGTFSGVNRSGLSNSGKSYKYNSATDRSAATGDKAYVSAQSGKAKAHIRGE